MTKFYSALSVLFGLIILYVVVSPNLAFASCKTPVPATKTGWTACQKPTLVAQNSTCFKLNPVWSDASCSLTANNDVDCALKKQMTEYDQDVKVWSARLVNQVWICDCSGDEANAYVQKAYYQGIDVSQCSQP